MSAHSSQTPQATPLHGLLVIVLAAVLATVGGSSMGLFWRPESESPGKCAYMVFQGDHCLGTLFFQEPQSVSEILFRAGIPGGRSAERSNSTIPCFRSLRIADEGLLERADRMVGAQIIRCGGRIDLNAGTREDLMAIPGIGPKLAQAIVNYRSSHGPFGAVYDLLGVKGIGRKKLRGLDKFVQVESPTESVWASTHPGRSWSALSNMTISIGEDAGRLLHRAEQSPPPLPAQATMPASRAPRAK